MFNIYITASGSGQRFFLGTVHNLTAGWELVQEYDRKWEAHEEAGYPALAVEDPLSVWEGCDVYAEKGSGMWALIGDNVWEIV